MTIVPTFNPRDLETILAERDLGEPFSTHVDLVVMGYDGSEPVGIVAGQMVVQPEPQPPLAWFKHIVLRPAWAKQRGEARALYAAWEAEALRRGCQQAIAGIPAGFDRRALARLGMRRGWTPYTRDATRQWWLRNLGTPTIQEERPCAVAMTTMS